MGRYINWDDVVDRYSEVNNLSGADEFSSAYIVYAEAFVDGSLATHFTTPFSSNNTTVRDLTIDQAYWRAARFKLESAVEVNSAFLDTVRMLKKGTLSMINDSGEVISNRAPSGMFSSTQSYHHAFDMTPTIEQHIDPDQITADRNRHNG